MPLMWTEAYRPKSLDEIVGHEENITSIKQFIQRPDFPHMLFYGPPGVGKTTCADAIISERYPRNEIPFNVFKSNASDNRRMRDVRQHVKQFATIQPYGTAKYKLVILDEADHLVNFSQQALRFVMERFSNISRFILICNYPTAIVDAIRSRCAIYRFTYLPQEKVISRLKEIAHQRKLKYDESGLIALYEVSEGDLRKAINTMQVISSLDNEIESSEVYEFSGYADPTTIRSVILECLKPDPNFNQASRKVEYLLRRVGVHPEILVQQFNRELNNLPTTTILEDVRGQGVFSLADIGYRITRDCSVKVQFDSFLAMLVIASQNSRKQD